MVLMGSATIFTHPAPHPVNITSKAPSVLACTELALRHSRSVALAKDGCQTWIPSAGSGQENPVSQRVDNLRASIIAKFPIY